MEIITKNLKFKEIVKKIALVIVLIAGFIAIILMFIYFVISPYLKLPYDSRVKVDHLTNSLRAKFGIIPYKYWPYPKYEVADSKNSTSHSFGEVTGLDYDKIQKILYADIRLAGGRTINLRLDANTVFGYFFPEGNKYFGFQWRWALINKSYSENLRMTAERSMFNKIPTIVYLPVFDAEFLRMGDIVKIDYNNRTRQDINIPLSVIWFGSKK